MEAPALAEPLDLLPTDLHLVSGRAAFDRAASRCLAIESWVESKGWFGPNGELGQPRRQSRRESRLEPRT
jgi:hypothetical protein